MEIKFKNNVKKGRVIIACSIMEAELEAIRKDAKNVEIRYLEQGLHRTPTKMASVIQAEIDKVADYAKIIVLGYGLCSNGVVGVKARNQPIIIPRCHDCITLFLGSRLLYQKMFQKNPGTYYLTEGWIRWKKDPLSILKDEYIPRVGDKKALWAMKMELQHYTDFVLIDSKVGDIKYMREVAKRNAEFFKKRYKEVKGSLRYFKKLFTCDKEDDDCIYIKPGEHITQEMFFL